ncbi:ImmA/IrrE family metallo-endopeptidase [Vibrio sp. 03-59-1]|uniref:ImmA/IrrE family metallo-endopeptidase n=1 Tax=Vibrio sp. 03-59-1 TaxID=2607607 RepID=UPI001493BC46|nr:ImmA/IrrE family metallo-endopeptidase [Vibrio sp. 03-59-1]NOH84666.1 ImmA/IrrE family metallo-endopeptidase [Vibrio sp. 03-59-1]
MKKCKEWAQLSSSQQDIILRHQSCFPIKIGALAKELGIIVKRSTLSPGISGVIKETDGVVVAKINRHDSPERQRFTLAHEIAHFLLHRNKIGDGIEDTMLFRSSLSNTLEAEANRLAADLIMPFSLIDKIEFPEETRLEVKIEYVASLAELSIPALEVRLGKKGF